MILVALKIICFQTICFVSSFEYVIQSSSPLPYVVDFLF